MSNLSFQALEIVNLVEQLLETGDKVRAVEIVQMKLESLMLQTEQRVLGATERTIGPLMEAVHGQEE